MSGYQYSPNLIQGTFTGSGQTSVSFQASPLFAVSLGGTFNATVIIERSPDNGTNWYPCSTDGTGSVASYTSSMSVDVESPLHALIHRLRCSAYSSGTVVWAVSL